MSNRDIILILTAIRATGSRAKLAERLQVHATEVGKMERRGWVYPHMRHLLRRVCREDWTSVPSDYDHLCDGNDASRPVT